MLLNVRSNSSPSSSIRRSSFDNAALLSSMGDLASKDQFGEGIEGLGCEKSSG